MKHVLLKLYEYILHLYFKTNVTPQLSLKVTCKFEHFRNSSFNEKMYLFVHYQ